MSAQGNQKLMISAWQARNKLYEDLLGAYVYSLPKIYKSPVSPEPGFQRQSNEAAGELVFDSVLRGQRISVLAFGPKLDRPYWTYVTSGLSNPWFQEEPGEVSGFGCELVVKSATDARWPIRLLRRLSYYLLSYSGTLSPGVILNMKAPIGATAAASLDNVLVWYVDEAPDCLYQLPSGAFGLFSVIGITEDEARFAESVEEYGTFCVQQVLRQVGWGQVTDSQRASVMQHEGIEQILNSVQAYAKNFSNLGL